MKNAYFAGLFDGEASLGVYAVSNGKDSGVYWSPKLAVVGTYRPLIEAILAHFGVGQMNIAKRNKGHHLGTKPQWQWQVTNKDGILIVLKKTSPFMPEKKEQADVMIAYCEKRIGGEEASLELKRLKQVSFPHSLGEPPRLRRGAMSEDTPGARTTYAVAQAIRERYAKGEGRKALSLSYGLSINVIDRIVDGKTYTNPPRPKYIMGDVVNP